MRLPTALSFVTLSTLALLSCSPSIDVGTLSSSLSNAQVTITQPPSVLVYDLSGSFDVSLALGERGSNAASVTLGAFSLVRSDNEAPLLSGGAPLSVVSAVPNPIAVNPGDQTTIHITIEADSSGRSIEISDADRTAICQAGQIKIVGQITDSTSGSTTATSSMPFAPSGC